MTTVVNNPGTSTDSGGSMGPIVAILLVAGLAVLFFVYGMPALRSTNGGTNTGDSAPAVVMPDKIDVNVQPAK